ncbi:MAG TPA: phytanoyl-CoA dioxygenase family protein, partial [Actinomycetota bacterium]
RVNYLNEQSELVAGLGADPRLRRIGGLAPIELRDAVDRMDGNGVVIKVPGADSGLADLPWHRDCGMGGHSVKCPLLNVGIQLDAATEATGRLHFVPGSWRYSCHRSDLARAPVVAVDTEPGDVTAHFGDVMHAAPPPTGQGPGRRALYVTCMPERAYEAIPAGKSYNDVILARVGA